MIQPVTLQITLMNLEMSRHLDATSNELDAEGGGREEEEEEGSDA